MAWLLDTNIVSEVWKPVPNSKVTHFLACCPGDQLYISIVAIAEFQHGANTVPDPIRQKVLTDWLTSVIRPMFQDRILAITEPVMLRWLMLVEQGRKTNHTFSQPDLFLAATALEHNLTLVTRNTKDFRRIADLQLFNPWTDTP